eukprot:Protomagalhaensia_sp_Gyna_25__5146@NODE_602_length_3032_cov_20_299365_g465_i0_p1_GENE_NODE_602_length_3032_cov_20_299365_g465_i0NODE_602_length_3032_cov_20_299365_g465_i0_p1_ORF_typecomplete_len681_score106_53DUF21/PF01595_20/1_4e38CBS/PF00571_28/71CBS/PF00571_28/0_00089PRK/PF00485_18/0_13_NODE_602_length_3032_cov_20_299365_g465_i0342076
MRLSFWVFFGYLGLITSGEIRTLTTSSSSSLRTSATLNDTELIKLSIQTVPTAASNPNEERLIHKTRFLDFRFSAGGHSAFFNVIISVLLVLFAGFASGMTVGLLSIDNIQLKILQEEGTADERSHAKRLEAVLANHHLLLVTLLLANSIAMEALPIFLNKTVPEWAAVALSVTAILAFGEVLPQALCTGKWQIPIVMKSLPIVDALIFLFYGLSWPIAKVLDYILGHATQTYYARSHLKALIRIHQRERRGGQEERNSQKEITSSDIESALGADEVVIIEGALDLANKMVEDVMVPMIDVYMLEWDVRLTPGVRKDLLEKGHSRVPVYKTYRHNVKGLLLVKTLICLDTHESPKVGDLVMKMSRPPIFCLPSLQLYDLLNEFQRGRHMAFVTLSPERHTDNWGNPYSHLSPTPTAQEQLLGIATLEDVIEELIQEEIYDEFDHYHSAAMFPRVYQASIDDNKRPSQADTSRPRLSLVASAKPEVPPELGLPAAKAKRMRDVGKPVPRGLNELGELNRRLMEDEPLLGQEGSTTRRSANAKRFNKSCTFVFKVGNEPPRTTTAAWPTCQTEGPLITGDSDPQYRLYHSSEINEKPEPRSVRNWVGITTARRARPSTRLITIQSSVNLSRDLDGCSPGAKTVYNSRSATSREDEEEEQLDGRTPAYSNPDTHRDITEFILT